MVNNQNLRIVDPCNCNIVPTPDAKGVLRRRITNGPVYDLMAVKDVVSNPDNSIKFVTSNAAHDKFKFDMGPRALRPFIAKLKAGADGHYKHSERCEASPATIPPPWELDCDAYAMKWNRITQQEFSDGMEFYLKFGFSDHTPGCLIVSIHD